MSTFSIYKNGYGVGIDLIWNRTNNLRWVIIDICIKNMFIKVKKLY